MRPDMIGPEGTNYSRLDHLYELVGKQTVLLPAALGRKYPGGNGNQNIELAQTLEPYYQKRLERAALRANVCARLGEKSGGLITIDLDLDERGAAKEAYEALIAANPWMEHTLTTQGRPNRCQIWFRVRGDYPRTRKKLLIKNAQGLVVGELRNGEGDQWQSVLKGLHPDAGKFYTFLVEEPAKEITWPELVWPPGWTFVEKADDPIPLPPGEGEDTPGREWWRKFGDCDLSSLDLPGLLTMLGVQLEKIKDKERPGWLALPHCPWEGNHHPPNKERDAAIMPPDPARGWRWWSFHCFHAGCSGRGLEALLDWAEAKSPGIVKKFCTRPVLILPCGTVSYPECARKLFSEFARTYEYFIRSARVVVITLTKLDDEQWHESFEILKPAAFRSRIDELFEVKAWRASKKKGAPATLKGARTPNDAACVLLETREAREILPGIATLSHCPILTGEPGKLQVLGGGYHRVGGGIYVLGTPKEIRIPSLEEARQIFDELLCDYKFASESDRSRAIAAFISPALRAGGLLGTADFPIDIAEADQSQSGKTYRQKLVCAVYGTVPYLITQRFGGVGSFDESIGNAVLSGVPFILIDNFRGRINCPPLESALRGIGFINIRVPYHGEIQASTRRLSWMLSSNGIEGGRDFANRSIKTEILKQPPGYKFKEYPGGLDILGRVKVDPGRYLGAVFSVITEWDRQGRQETAEKRHEFRGWARPLDWIVQNIFKTAPLCDGHEEAVARMSGPALSWLRLVANALAQAGALGDKGVELEADQIAGFCDTHGLDIPGMGPTHDEFQRRVQVGRLLGQAFSGSEKVKAGRLLSPFQSKSSSLQSFCPMPENAQFEIEIIPPSPRPGMSQRGGRPRVLTRAAFSRICGRVREGRHRWSKERAVEAEGISYETFRRAGRRASWARLLTLSERVGEIATLEFHRQNMTDHAQVDWRASERYVLLHDPAFAKARLTNNYPNNEKVGFTLPPNIHFNDADAQIFEHNGRMVMLISVEEEARRIAQIRDHYQHLYGPPANVVEMPLLTP